MSVNYRELISSYSAEITSNELINNSFKEISPFKGNYKIYFGPIILSAITIYSLYNRGFDSTIIDTLISFICNVQLGLFSCLFTVYSIFSIFLDKEYITLIIGITDKDGTPILKRQTDYPESILFLNLMSLGLTILIKFVLISQVDLLSLICLNEHIILAILGILWFIYCLFILRVFFELKSTIYNTILIFRCSIISKVKCNAIRESKK